MRCALVLLALGTAVTAQETKHYEDVTRVFAIDLPAAWEVETRRGSQKALVIKFRCQVPGVKGSVYLDLWSLDGIELTARAQARYERATQVERFKASHSEVVLEPLPHLRLDYHREDGEACAAAFAYKRRLCRGLVLVLMCRRAAWPDLREPFLNAAQGMSSTLGRYPDDPVGYQRHEHAGFVFWSAPGFKASARKRIQKIFAETQRWFVKLHGPIERPPAEPPYVFLHTFKREARSLSKDAAEAEHGHMADTRTRAVYAIPVPALGSSGHAYLVTRIHQLLFAEKYGDVYPEWVQAGDSELFAERVETGKRLPFVSQAWKANFPCAVIALDQLEPIQDTTDWDSYVHHGMAYTLLFRLGPSKYRKAYAGFLKALRDHGDWDHALRDHLYVLDQRELLEATNQVLARKVKGVERRR